MDENRFKRLEDDVRSLHDKLDLALENNGNRITKLETQAGFIKAGLAFLGSILLWALNKFIPHQ